MSVQPLHRPQAARDKWLPFGAPRLDAAIRIFAFSYAGGGAGVFRSLARAMPPSLDLCPVQLPGREARIDEPPISRLDDLRPKLLAALRPHLNRPFILLGYSLGAIIAYDLACHLAAEQLPQPLHLIACARGGPRVAPRWRDETPPSDADLIARLKDLGGTAAAVLEHAELLALVLPILRADFALNASFARQDCPMLDYPVTAIGGLGDHAVGAAQLGDWSGVTSARFRQRMLRGGHFFIQEAPLDFAEAVIRAAAQGDAA